MARIYQIVFVVFTAVALAACGSKEEKPQAEVVPDCTFPDDPSTPAPAWICDEPVPEYPVTAVGTSQKSAAGLDFMKDQAAASARVRLAQQMQVHVMNMVKQYTETTGTGDSETVDQVRTSVSKIVTDQELYGTRIVKTRTSPATGTLYVLVGMDEQNTAANTQATLRTSMGNDQALWQQFKAEKGFDELAAEIANQN